MPGKRGVWVVALLIGGAACSSGSTVSTTTTGIDALTTTTLPAPSSTTSAVPTTTAPAVPGPSALEWTRVRFESSGDVARWMTGVAVLDGLLIAVGNEMSHGDGDAAVWTSLDGATWSRVPHDEGVFGGDGLQVMNAIAAFDGGVVAVGSDRSGPGGGRPDGAVWVSPDGISWSRIGDDSTFQESEIFDVARHAGGLVAVGVGFPRGDGAPPGSVDAAVWLSADGDSWTRVASGALDLESTEWMRGVAGGASAIVAVGISHRADDVEGAIWTSADGAAWARVEEAFGGFGTLIREVVPNGPGFIAVGWAGVDAAVWSSPDGATWTRVPHDPDVFGGSLGAHPRIWSAVAVAGGVVAVGHTPTEELEDAGVWLSDDGVAWTGILDEALLGGPGQQIMEAIVEFDGGLVAVGRGGDGTVPTPGVWLARPPGG